MVESGSVFDTRSTCPYCGVGCGVAIDKDKDGLWCVTGDSMHPANRGKLCSKGSALAETLVHENRLLHPMVDDQKVHWDTALDRIATEFSAAIETHGPDSVAFYVSGQLLTEDYYVANKLMKGYIGSANIDTNSRLCMASSVAGHRRAFGADTVPGCYDDLELADLVVLVGSNLSWCHPVLFQRLVKVKSERPDMKLVVIDPRRTATSDSADLHLAIRPDADVALFMGLLADLEHSDSLDADYIRQHTAGFDETVKRASECSLEHVGAETGLSLAELRTFYDLFNGTHKTVTVYSQGVNQSSCGTDKVNAIINCHLATGRIGKPGCGPFSITGQPNAMGGREVGGLANMLACHMDIEREDHRSIVQGFWQSPTIACKAGLKAVDLFKAVEDGRIKALWVMATNPVVSLPVSNQVRKAIEHCPFVVVSDVVNKTDTLELATVSLPALAWGEKDGTVTNSERLISRQRGFKTPPGEGRADWWALAQVGKRLGFSDAFNYQNSAEIFKEYAALSGFKNRGDRDFDISACDSITKKQYETMVPFYWPMKKGDEPVKRRFFAEGGFFHEDKRARFVPVKLIVDNRLTAEHPFSLNTGRIRDQWHTMTRTGYSPRLSAHIGEPFVEIHPADAEQLNISSAELAKIENNHGSIVIRSLVTDRQQRGSVFVPMHWTDQFASSARVDTLVPPVTDPVSGQPASKHVAVSVKSNPVECYGFAVLARKPTNIEADYWALAPCKSGWRVEFALRQWPDDIEAYARKFHGLLTDVNYMSYVDKGSRNYRSAVFKGDQLKSSVYLSATPVLVSRAWLGDQLSEKFDDAQSRYRVTAGSGGGDKPDIGAIVCSCFSVGANPITSAVTQGGCSSVDEIGAKLSAGTNCGSCKAEIAVLIVSAQEKIRMSSVSQLASRPDTPSLP